MWNIMRFGCHVNTFRRLPTLIFNKSYALCPVKNEYISCCLNHHHNIVNKYSNIITFKFHDCIQSNSIKHFSTSKVLLKEKDRGKKKKTVVHVDLKEMEEVLDVNKLMSGYEGAIENMKDQYIKNLSVRTTFGSIEELPINFEGTDYTLQDLVQISRKPKLIVLNASAFPQTIPQIIQSLTKSNMNLNPQQDGTKIYVQIPKITKEHRENLSKTAKGYFNNCRESITDVRNKHIKKLKKDAKVPIDLSQRVESYIDILSRQYVDKAQKMLEAKQKELLGE